MTLIVPNEGELVFLNRMINPASGGENYTLRLFTSNTTPASTDVVGTYTAATFTGYSDQTLTQANWGAATGNPASSTYNTAITWTNSGVGAQSIYGYIIFGASTNTLYVSERFSSAPRVLNVNDTISITPAITLT